MVLIALGAWNGVDVGCQEPETAQTTKKVLAGKFNWFIQDIVTNLADQIIHTDTTTAGQELINSQGGRCSQF